MWRENSKNLAFQNIIILARKFKIPKKTNNYTFQKILILARKFEFFYQIIISLFLADDTTKRKQMEQLVKSWDSRPNSSTN